MNDPVKIKQPPHKSHENNEKEVQISSINTISLIEEQDVSSNKVLKPLKVLERQKEIEKKINETELYRKWPGSDIWACPNCNDIGDKFYMVGHICKNNKKN